MSDLSLNRPGAVLRYLDFPGEEPALVFIHGLGCAGSSHFPEVAALPPAATHRRIIPDLLGHGFSDRPDDFAYTVDDHAQTMIELLDHLSLRGCMLFGHSMGGAIAITVAAIRPDLVSRLMLAEANLDPGGGSVSKLIAGQSEDEFVLTGHAALLDRWPLGPFQSVGSFRVCDSRALHRSAVGVVRGTEPTMRERLYAMRIPRAYIFSEKGLPDEDFDELPRHGIQPLVVANAGHDMMFDNPVGVADAIKQALYQLAERG